MCDKDSDPSTYDWERLAVPAPPTKIVVSGEKVEVRPWPEMAATAGDEPEPRRKSRLERLAEALKWTW